VGSTKGRSQPAEARGHLRGGGSIFFDDAARLFDDPDHSAGEERYLLLGLSAGLRVLVVAHCIREEGDVIRIISARRATRAETEVYVGGET
jgi:uncharacterized DUF497 family protein